MSINARIASVTRVDGWPVLHLVPWEKDPAGQPALYVIGACDTADRLTGHHIWGNSKDLAIGEVIIGRRIGYTKCVLFNHAIREATRAKRHARELEKPATREAS